MSTVVDEILTPRPVTARCIDVTASWGAMAVVFFILVSLC